MSSNIQLISTDFDAHARLAREDVGSGSIDPIGNVTIFAHIIEIICSTTFAASFRSWQ